MSRSYMRRMNNENGSNEIRTEEDIEREAAERDFKEKMFNAFSKQFSGVSFDEETGCIVIQRPVKRRDQ